MQSGGNHPGGLVSRMKLKTIRRILIEFAVNHILVGTKLFSLKRKLLRSIGYQIGENTKVVGPLHNTGELHIGDNCWIGKNLTVHGNGTVEIGNNCDIAPDVTFLTGGHQLGNAERRAGSGETYHITVGNGVWIGARATILHHITIGDGAVIATCACVIRDVSDNTLVGGVPARIIKELEDGAAKHI